MLSDFECLYLIVHPCHFFMNRHITSTVYTNLIFEYLRFQIELLLEVETICLKKPKHLVIQNEWKGNNTHYIV